MTEPYTPKVGDFVQGTSKDGSGFTFLGEVVKVLEVGYVAVGSAPSAFFARHFVWELAERPVPPLPDGLYEDRSCKGNFVRKVNGFWKDVDGYSLLDPAVDDGQFHDWVRYVPAGSGETR